MEYEDRLRITTPEGLDLDLTLAGIGSRFVATLLDTLLRTVVGGALIALIYLVTDGGVALLLVSTLVFLLLFAYDLAFEVLASGRTPGKRWAGLRVLRESGAPVTVAVSAVRNIIRLLDFLPLFYLVAMASVVLTKRNQRVGDVVAGTVVVRERVGGRTAPAMAPPVPAHRIEPAGWDTTAVTAEDLVTVQRFLARRNELERGPRATLAAELEGALRRKVAAPGEVRGETFLEQLATLRESR